MGGCQKDYDGQLEIIRNQIKSGEISLDNLNSKVILIDEQIAVLQKALEDAETTEEHKKDIQAVLKKLDDVKTELEGKIAGLEKKIEDNNEELIGIKESIESLEQQFNEKLLTISIEIQGIGDKLDVLDRRVGKLEEQLGALQEKQSAIEDAIAALEEEIEKGEEHSQEQIEELKQALADLNVLQGTLTGRIEIIEKDLVQIKANVGDNKAAIDKAANQIAELYDLIDNIVAGKNLATMEDLKTAINKIDEKFAKALDERLVALRKEYDEKLKVLADLIESGSSEELKNLIKKVNNDLAELNKTVKKHLEDYLTTTELVGTLKTKVTALENTIEEHKTKLADIDNELNSIKADIQNLFNRIQSMVIIPEYAGNYVKLETADAGSSYTLTMNVDIRPFSVAEEIAKGAFSISVKPVNPIPTRATSPTFTITEMDADSESKTFKITASTMNLELASSIYSAPTAFQVALVLNNPIKREDDDKIDDDKIGDDRLSEYMGVYYVAPGSQDVDIPYDFYIGEIGNNNKLKVSESTNIVPEDFYLRDFLTNGSMAENASYSIFDKEIIAEGGDYPSGGSVEFDLAGAAFNNGVMSSDLAKCFTVSSNGAITRIGDVSGVPDLTGVRLFIGLQAKAGNVKWGKHCYICIVLKNKD